MQVCMYVCMYGSHYHAPPLLSVNVQMVQCLQVSCVSSSDVKVDLVGLVPLEVQGLEV